MVMAVVLPKENWTDKRLDERFDRIDERFEQVDRRLDRLEADIRELRTIMLGGFVTLLAAIIGTTAF